MKITKLDLLEAEEGMVLTDGVNFCSSILLAKGRSIDEFREITVEEYESIVGEPEEGGN